MGIKMQSLTLNRSQANQFISTLAITTVAFVVAAIGWYLLRLDLKWTVFGFMGLMFPFVLALVKDVRRFLIWLMVFLLPLGLDYKFFYEKVHAGQQGISIGTTEIILFLLLIHWMISAARQKMTRRVQFYPAISLPTLALILMYLVSMIAAKNPMLSLFDAVALTKILLFFLYLANNLRDEEDIAILLSALFFGLIVQAGFMIMQYYRGAPLGLIGTDELQNFLAFRREGVSISRPGGTIGDVNSFARYLGFLLPIALVMLLTNQKRSKLPLVLFASLGGIIALIVSQTRSVWGPFMVCMFFAVVLIFTRRLLTMRVIKRLIFALLLFSAVLVVYRDVIYHRLTANDYGSANSRLTTAKVALDIIRDHPVIGIGANNYDYYIRDYWLIEDAFTKIAIVHNNYLLVAAQIGMIGFGAFIWLLVALFARIRRAMHSRVAYLRQIAVGIMASFILYSLSALADVYQRITLLFMFWTLAAIVEAINRLEKEYDERLQNQLLESRTADGL